MIECCICKRGPQQGIAVFRINAKGVTGIWACEKHLKQTDAPPVDPLVTEICKAVGRAEIQDMERTVGRLRSPGIEGHQPSCQKNQNLF